MYLTAAGKQYCLELFSGYTTTVDSSSYTLSFGSEHEFMEWLREICGKSDFRATTYLTRDDRIVTLSTCAYSFQDARYVRMENLLKIKKGIISMVKYDYPCFRICSSVPLIAAVL